MTLRVLMIGTSLELHGGVASVLSTWRDAGLFERCSVRYVATNGPGGRARKLLMASSAWVVAGAAMLSNRYDIVHIHVSSYGSFWRKSPLLACALLLRCRLVVSLHGGGFQGFYAQQGRLARVWIRCIMRGATRFIVLTDAWRGWVLAEEPRARVEVIPNTTPCPVSIDAERPDLKQLLFLGRIERDKGIHVLIDALALAARQGAHWRLICAGEGDIKGARRAAMQVGLSGETIKFVGWVDAAARTRCFRECSLLVLPSLIENMPVSVIEAFAHGKPVIASLVGGLPDMVRPGVNGWLVTPGSATALAGALIQAWRHASDLQTMGGHARAKALTHYAPAVVIDSVARLYGTLIRE